MYDIAVSEEMKSDESPPVPNHPDNRFRFAPEGKYWVLASSSWQVTRTKIEQVSVSRSESTHFGRWVWTWELRPVL